MFVLALCCLLWSQAYTATVPPPPPEGGEPPTLAPTAAPPPTAAPTILFNFGLAEGDTELPRGLWHPGPLITIPNIRYQNELRNTLRVYINGLMGFTGGAFVRVFQGPVDTTDPTGGNVFYREVADAATRDAISVAIRAAFYTDFQATWAVIATWDAVAARGGGPERNTFQCVIGSDGANTFAILNYAELEWHTASGAGAPASVGFNDGLTTYHLPESRTAAVAGLNADSNVRMPGRWVFRVDQISFASPPTYNCHDASPCLDGQPNGIFYYTHDIANLFIQCDRSAGCTEYECPFTMTWDATLPTCVRAAGHVDGTYDCLHANPCDPLLIADDYFYAHADPTKFVHCGAWGECSVETCQVPGTTFNDAASVCT